MNVYVPLSPLKTSSLISENSFLAHGDTSYLAKVSWRMTLNNGNTNLTSNRSVFNHDFTFLHCQMEMSPCARNEFSEIKLLVSRGDSDTYIIKCYTELAHGGTSNRIND